MSDETIFCNFSSWPSEPKQFMNWLFVEFWKCSYTYIWQQWTISFWKKILLWCSQPSILPTLQLFLFDGLAWNYYSMEIICYNNVTTMYSYCTRIIHLTENAFFMAWLEKIYSLYCQANSLMVRLKNMIWSKQKFPIFWM